MVAIEELLQMMFFQEKKPMVIASMLIIGLIRENKHEWDVCLGYGVKPQTKLVRCQTLLKACIQAGMMRLPQNEGKPEWSKA